MRESQRLVINRVSLALGVTFVLLAAGVLVFDGRLPASVPSEAPPYAPARLMDAMQAVDSRGLINREKLKAHEAQLHEFIDSMAKSSPTTTAELFPSADARLAWALNAFHALTLDAMSRSETAVSRWHFWAIGGQYLPRAALRRRFIDAVEDPRMALVVFDGTTGTGVLDGAPFAEDTLERQLNEAVKRFMQRPANVRIEGKVVHLSTLITSNTAQFLKRVPADRQNLLQVVWAFLPDSCEGLAPGCATRADLDRTCGVKFDQCQVIGEPADTSLAFSGR